MALLDFQTDRRTAGGYTVGHVKEPWIVFFGPDDQELFAYTVRGNSAGDLEATIELLAYENGWEPCSIYFAEITR